MLRFAKVATPATAAIVVVPPRVPPEGLAPNATVTLVDADVTVLPRASSTVTWTGGLIAAPGVTLVGWTAKANLAAGPACTSKAAEVAPIRPLPAAVRV